MLKNWMLVCSKAKMEIPIQYTVTLEQSFLGICNEPLNCKNTAPGRLLACQRRHLRRRYTVWLPGWVVYVSSVGGECNIFSWLEHLARYLWWKVSGLSPLLSSCLMLSSCLTRNVGIGSVSMYFSLERNNIYFSAMVMVEFILEGATDSVGIYFSSWWWLNLYLESYSLHKCIMHI